MILRQGIDSKALLVTVIRTLPRLILIGVAGALLGSGLHCLITFWQMHNAMLVSETEYYVDFAEGRLEARDYYNAFTWNDAIATDEILGRMMETLGSGYDRDAVKQMLYAEILSDVRYLTMTIKGTDEGTVSAVSAAFELAIAQFAKSKDEFDAIYKIEDNGVIREQPDWFVWRAAFLGAVIFVGIGMFLTVLAFVVGDRFYTKTDVMKFLKLRAVGMLYKSGNEQSGLQERRLIQDLKALLEQYQRLYLLDGTDGQDAGQFLETLDALGADLDCGVFVPCEQYHTEEEAAILVIVPFGKVYREKITDEINNAVLHGGAIAGAVLTQCDKAWVGMYYGKGVKA